MSIFFLTPKKCDFILVLGLVIPILKLMFYTDRCLNIQLCHTLSRALRNQLFPKRDTRHPDTEKINKTKTLFNFFLIIVVCATSK